MLIPKNVLKLGKYAEKNDGMYSGSDKSIFLRRVSDTRLQAVVMMHGHFLLAVDWIEIPVEDFPMLPIIPGFSQAASPTPISLQASVCEKALKSMGRKNKTMPILDCLLAEEVYINGKEDKLRCFTTDLDDTYEFNNKFEDSDRDGAEAMFKWFDKTELEFVCDKPRTAVNAEYLATIYNMLKDVFDTKAVAVKMEFGQEEYPTVRLSAEKDGIKAICILMPIVV